MKTTLPYSTALALLVFSSPLAQAAVVFAEVNLVNDTIILSNTGDSIVDLDGWRFCSHDVDSVRVYSSTSQFNGLSIGIGESFTVDTTSINFAGPLGGNTLSVGLYVSSSFSSSDALEAFIQFAPEGTADVGNAEFRTNTAVTAGLWDAEGSFVQVNEGDTSISLNDLTSSIGAASFSTIPEPSSTLLLGLTGLLAVTRRKRNR